MPTTRTPKAKPAAKPAATRGATPAAKAAVKRRSGPAAGAPTAGPQWTVTLQPDANFAQAARALHAAGMAISDKLDAIGVINGAAPERLLGRLRQVAGVADVSPLLGFDVGPPDSGVS